jgi:glucuronate isomerase
MNYITEDFLLQSKTARKLFHDYAEKMPIIDYHCHLSPRMIAEDISFETITHAWLSGDHYKWRAMRANGIDEKFITGNATDKEKFDAWAATVPYTMRNPLFDWTHLELKRYFGINDAVLRHETSSEIYAACNAQIKEKNFSAKNLLRRMNVRVVCTTDDPIDDLSYHQKMKDDGFEIAVLPTFRPDKAIAVDDPVAYNAYINSLALVAGQTISSIDDLLEVLEKRHEYFHAHGCRCSDHGVETMSLEHATRAEISAIFFAVRSGTSVGEAAALKFKTALLSELCKMNFRKGWVQQIHVGVIRNTRTRLLKSIGPETGIDCIGDFVFGKPLCRFFDALDSSGQLTKTILFNINPGNNEQFVSIAGVFQDGAIAGKMQLGPAWWFLDQKQGMTEQLNAISNFGLLSRFVGMTTDSRSLLSFPRHEYFRRILCNILGEEMERGEIPDDIEFIGKMIGDICFFNAKNYFGYS